MQVRNLYRRINMTGNLKDDLTKDDGVPEANPKKKRYEKPTITEKPGMIFPKEVMEYFSSGTKWCFSCTNCNCN
jgi:hypothetical protein